jgi:predicted dienelactone hydrolase
MRARTTFSTATFLGAALASALLAAGPAAAQSCLDGAAALGDQRDLRALAAEIEAICPCASFDGSPGFKHASYVSCGKQVRKNAVFFGQLRQECVGEANRALRKSTCGGDKIACGRYREGARKPVGCRVKPADRCADRPRFAEEVCSQTHCSEVEEWTAGTCLDPREPGPYGAGARVVSWTKPSAVDPEVDRVLETVIWYPTADAGAPTPAYEAILDASVDTASGPYPVVLFSHGSCGFPLQSIFLTAHLATHGFVVVAPPHPGNTLFEFPDCGTPSSLAAAFVERPEDAIHALDRMLEADRDPASPFFGAIDETRLGMGGHSFGGLTTYLVLERDDRFSVAMPLAAATTQTAALDVPSLTMLGEIDSVVDNDGIRAAYARSEDPRWLVGVQDAGHYAFSDGCFPSPDCNPPETLTQEEAHERVKRWVLPFLEVHLADDRSFAPFLLADPPPGVRVERE